jgi:hypothetical protein
VQLRLIITLLVLDKLPILKKKNGDTYGRNGYRYSLIVFSACIQ